MKSRSIFILGTLSVMGLLALILVNTKAITEGNYNYLRAGEEKEGKSYHGAAAYLNMIKADPSTGEINPAYVLAAQKQLDRMSRSRAGLSLTWDFRGPDNVGGRTRVIIIDNKDHNTLYAGGVSGGIFKSVSGGDHWISKSYTAELGGLIISSGAQAPNGDIYFGTGEQKFTVLSTGVGNSGAIGGGIYKSTDRGETWSRLSSTDPSSSAKWENITAIAINPVSGAIYAATQTGLQESTDGGSTWASYPGSTGVLYQDVKVSPDGKTVFASTYTATGCKLYRSIDHGNLAQVGSGTLSQSTLRFVIAIAPSNPNYVYISAASSGSGDSWGREALDGIYRSTDNGSSWTKIVLGGTDAEPFGTAQFQGLYDNTIAVDPYNADRFFVGGVDFYMYDAGMWYKAASLNEFNDPKNSDVNEYYIHADKHYIAFDTVSKPYKMFVTTDGGIAISTNAQKSKYPTYKTININFTTSQFYALAANKYDDMIGGTQDNGTFLIQNNSLTGKNATEILGGDGFNTEISYYDPNIFINESQYGNLYRSKDRGVNQQTLLTGLLKKELKPNNLGNYPFNTPFRLWEDKKIVSVTDSNHVPPTFDSLMHISKLFFAPMNEVWVNLKTHDFSQEANEWFKVSNSSMLLNAICMEYTSDGNTLFIGGSTHQGSNTGYLYRITGLKDAEYKFTGGTFDPEAAGIKTELIYQWSNRVVTGIGISPGNNNNVVVTLGNYVSPLLKHVYLSTNALDTNIANITFSSIHGDLPSFPVYDAAVHSNTNSTDTIIITTEMGVFTTTNGGTNWVESNSGMYRVPSYMVRQVRVEPWYTGYKYYICTHGRGIFSTSIGQVYSAVYDESMKRPDLTIYPNPANVNANIIFNLVKPSDINLQIYDLNGKMVYSTRYANTPTGKNTFTVNIANFKPGTYLVRANIDGRNLTSKLLVTQQ